MADPAELQVQLCYAAPGLQILMDLQVAQGCTIQQVILQSGLLRQEPTIDLSVCKVGIFGKVKTLETPVRERDRIEIYRPLIADPKQSRRRRAAHQERVDGQ
jgi:hypothetical protein